MALKAVFLDLGGTLVDLETDMRAHQEMMKAFRDAAGLRAATSELYEKFQTRREEQIMQLGTRWLRDQTITREVVTGILEDEAIPMSKEHWDAFQQAYWDEHERWIDMFPETEHVLRRLQEMSLHTGLLSDVDEDFLQLCLFKFKLDTYLDSITTSEEVGFAKPDEEIFRVALSKASCDAAEAVYVGDSLERDIVGAARIGMRSVLIGKVTQGLADFMASDLEEAYRVIRRLKEDES